MWLEKTIENVKPKMKKNCAADLQKSLKTTTTEKNKMVNTGFSWIECDRITVECNQIAIECNRKAIEHSLNQSQKTLEIRHFVFFLWLLLISLNKK